MPATPTRDSSCVLLWILSGLRMSHGKMQAVLGIRDITPVVTGSISSQNRERKEGGKIGKGRMREGWIYPPLSLPSFSLPHCTAIAPHHPLCPCDRTGRPSFICRMCISNHADRHTLLPKVGMGAPSFMYTQYTITVIILIWVAQAHL